MLTLCSDCVHVRLEYKSAAPWHWYCARHPRLAGWGFVTDRMLNLPPYLRCSDVNGGACPLYEAGPNQITKLTDEESSP